jgi:hypothetical protein
MSLSGQMVLTSATENTASQTAIPIATFSDTNLSDLSKDFTATINWGDGRTESGIVLANAGSVTVEGNPGYTDEGNFTATVTLTRTADQLQSTVSGNVAVAEGDVLTVFGHFSFTIAANQPFRSNGPVGEFGNSTFNPPEDFTASIDWGDGQTTAGTVGLLRGFEAYTVTGLHTYAAPGQYTMEVTFADDAPGTASATETNSVTVLSPNPFDFNGDGISDLVFQNEGAGATGTPQIWLWNGTAVTSQMTYGNPGAGWHIVTSRDVNGDGNADLIWQNSDGTPGIWLMNGTTPVAEAGLANPGPTWHIVASGDTNADGKSDLIWQNSDGTLGVWLMNGTTPIAEAGIGNPGANWKVVGAADYDGDGRDDILLQDRNTGNLMIDLMNGTTISSTTTFTVGDPSWHAVSTGDFGLFTRQAEIAWQNNDGTVGIWLMNGTTPASEAALANPGAAWQLISIDHFTPGAADLLFQNTSGAMGLWVTTGVTVAATLNLPNPGAGWQSENGHPATLAG